MKVLAMYLPQYHEIKENNEWWGKGYTEWNAVRGAKKYFEEHEQPRVPLDDNYYDLSDEQALVWKWQAQLAKEYNVYGFCIYHYWFKTGNQLLEKPMEILLEHPEIDIKYTVCWANETWQRTWYGLSNEVLKKQEYLDEKEWETHFEYLLNFFRDKRYIKIDNKPVVHIYHSAEISRLGEMRALWEKKAKENGFAGIYIVSGNTGSELDNRLGIIDAYYNFEPAYSLKHNMSLFKQVMYMMRKKFAIVRNKVIKNNKVEVVVDADWIYKCNTGTVSKGGVKCYLGTFPEWDNTPRRQYKGSIYISSPGKFKRNLMQIRNKLETLGRGDDFVYINAWNEWGEGAYLEPDTRYRYGFLEAIKSVIK